MNWYVALAVLLGLALIGAVVALFVTEQRNRPPKPVPAGPAVLDREALDVIDAGLRRLTGACLRAGRALPDLYGVRYSGERLDLVLAGTEDSAPEPWTADESGEHWTATREALERPGPEGEPALPYALTVTVGTAGPDRVLVDLSRAASTVAVSGPDAEVRGWARAVVTEVLTGPVGGLAEVTLVGSLATDETLNGAGLRSSRLYSAASLEEALARTAGTPVAPAGAAGADVTQIFRLIEGRSQVAVEGDAPHLFLVDASQLPRREGALDALRTGDAVLVLGDAPAAWRWQAGADGTLDTGPLGLDVDRHAGRLG